ncbi:hypothetical protein THAOC_13335, partial [Thalassiosira oceanica]
PSQSDRAKVTWLSKVTEPCRPLRPQTSHEAAWEWGTGKIFSEAHKDRALPTSASSRCPKTRAISGRAVPMPQGNPRDQNWNDMYRELKDFEAEHRHCNVPQSQGSLGRWVSKQRQARKKEGNLSGSASRNLTSSALTGALKAQLRQKPLGSWVQYQRKHYKKGNLSEERIKELEELGFEWQNRNNAGAVGGEEDSARERKRRSNTRVIDRRFGSSTSRFLGDAGTNSAMARSEATAAEPVTKASASDVISAASDDEEQTRPSGGADREVLNSDVHMSSSGDVVLDNSDGLTESTPAGDDGKAGERNAAGKHAPDNGASASMMPPLSNLADQTKLVRPDRGNRKPGSFLPDSVISSGQNGGDDETVCTTEDILDSQDEDGESNITNEHTAGGNGALKARIEELEAENHAKDEMMRALEAVNRAKDEKIKALEAFINVKDERMKTKDERMKALEAANHAKDERIKALQDEIAHFRRASQMPK